MNVMIYVVLLLDCIAVAMLLIGRHLVVKSHRLKERCTTEVDAVLGGIWTKTEIRKNGITTRKCIVNPRVMYVFGDKSYEQKIILRTRIMNNSIEKASRKPIQYLNKSYRILIDKNDPGNGYYISSNLHEFTGKVICAIGIVYVVITSLVLSAFII